MSVYETAYVTVVEVAGTLEAKAKQLGIMRSLPATRASTWLSGLAGLLRASLTAADAVPVTWSDTSDPYPVNPSSPDDLRAKGWAVAVHNDYKLKGKPYTFWLMTKGEVAVRGEGADDAKALGDIRARIRELENAKD